MSLSNKFGALVLSTGNKSELGVGYCTLYGDMVGGLAVISDVPKTLVYRLAELRQLARRPRRHSPAHHRQAALRRTPPRPERFRFAPALRCPRRHSRRLCRRSRSAEAIARSSNFDLDLVQRVIRMIVRSEYKRQQAAPGIKITPKAFGYGRRFPIAAVVE